VQVRERWLRCGVWSRPVSSLPSGRQWPWTHCQWLQEATFRTPRPDGWGMNRAAAHRSTYAVRARTTRAVWTVRGCPTPTASRVSVTRRAGSLQTAVSTTRAPADVSQLLRDFRSRERKRGWSRISERVLTAFPNLWRPKIYEQGSLQKCHFFASKSGLWLFSPRKEKVTVHERKNLKEQIFYYTNFNETPWVRLKIKRLAMCLYRSRYRTSKWTIAVFIHLRKSRAHSTWPKRCKATEFMFPTFLFSAQNTTEFPSNQYARNLAKI